MSTPYNQYINFKTPFAKKYGKPDPDLDNEDFFKSANKSGYTPISSNFHLASRLRAMRHQKIENFQRNFSLCGFTARELVDIGAYPDPNIQHTALHNAIHPLYQPSRWETKQDRVAASQACIPVEADGDEYSFGNVPLGEWFIHNPVIWQVFEPVLRLASRMIDDAHSCPLLDAYFNGRWSQVPAHLDSRSPYEKHRKGPAWYFTNQLPGNGDPGIALSNRRGFFQDLEKRVRLKFGSASMFIDNTTKWPVYNQGLTVPIGPDGQKANVIYVQLARELVQPLLRNDLSPSERLLEQFNIALVLAHETMHALHGARAHQDLQLLPWQSYVEPFYESHIFSELGFALEVDILDGILILRPAQDDIPNLGLPHLCAFVASHPNRMWSVSWNQTILANQIIPLETSIQPLPARYFHNIQSEAFWDGAVKKWGLQMMKPMSGLHSYTDHSWGQDSYTQVKMLRHQRFWQDDTVDNFKNKSREELLALSPQEIQAYIVAVKLHEDHRARQQKIEFRLRQGERAALIRDFLHYLVDAETLGYMGNEQYVRTIYSAQRLILEDADAQLVEIVRFLRFSVQDDKGDIPVYDQNHLKYLHYHNRKLRDSWNILQRFVAAAAIPELASQHDKIKLLSYIGFSMLQKEPRSWLSIPSATTTTQILLQIQNTLNPVQIAEQILQRDAAQHNHRADPAFMPLILAEAKTAVENDNAENCKRLGLEIFENFTWNPFLRAVGIICLSRDGVEAHKGLVKQMGWVEECSLATTVLVDEVTRSWWHGIFGRLRNGVTFGSQGAGQSAVGNWVPPGRDVGTPGRRGNDVGLFEVLAVEGEASSRNQNHTF